MSARSIRAGSADQSTVIRIIDATDGTPETGVTSATGGLDLQYRREGATAVALTESDLSALDDAHSDGGMLHIGAGYYRVDLPDAAVAGGAAGVLVFGTVTGMVVIGTYHPLVAYNPLDGVRLGLTALPSAAADAAGGLPVSALNDLAFTVLASGTIGDTGNSTTALHLVGQPFGDNEIRDHLLIARDVSAGEYHSRWVDSWTLSSALATIAATDPLPFTPEDSVDTYVVLAIRRRNQINAQSFVAGAINGAAIAASAISSAKIATDALTANAFNGAACNKFADHFWRRQFANVKNSSNGDTKIFRSGLGLMGKLVNRLRRNGASLETYEDDDTTVLGTQAITTDAAADPISELDTT